MYILTKEKKILADRNKIIIRIFVTLELFKHAFIKKIIRTTRVKVSATRVNILILNDILKMYVLRGKEYICLKWKV